MPGRQLHFQRRQLFLARARVQDQCSIVPDRLEVEHLGDRVGDSIEGAAAQALSAEPVVLDEMNDRTLIGHAVIDKILPSPG